MQFNQQPTQVDREVRAIDSEHNNNVPEDAWRIHQVFKQSQLFCKVHKSYEVLRMPAKTVVRPFALRVE